MFAKRKRREEQESLVPHGLVWQATAGESSPEKTTPKLVVTENRAPNVASVSMSTPAAGSNASQVSETPKKPAVSSPPPFWRPQPSLGVVKPVAANRLRDIKRDSAPVRADRNSRVAYELVRTVEQALIRCREQASRTWKFTAGVMEKYLLRTKAFSRRGQAAVGNIRQRARTRYSALELGPRLRARRQWYSQELFVGAKRFGSAAVELKNRASTLARMAGAYAGLHCRQARVSVADLAQRARARRSEASTAPRTLQIQVRLAGVPLRARILFTQKISEWRLKTESADSRMWNAMAMGACCALLAVGLVSVGRHYADASLPSHMLRTNISPSPNTTVTTPPLQAAVSPHPRVKKSNAHPVLTKEAIPSRPAAQTTRTKTRRHVEDDYVARDTYVYYGDDPGRSR
jgi:hypothetical protein